MLQQSDSIPSSNATNDPRTVFFKKIGASFNQVDWEKLVFLCGPWVTEEDEYRIFNCVNNQEQTSTIGFNLRLLLYAICSSKHILNRDSDDKILQELLYVLKKFRDLRVFFPTCKHRLNEEGIKYIDPFWKFLFDIVEELDDESLKFFAVKLLGKENAIKVLPLAPGFRYAKELFSYIIRNNEITKDNVQRFKQVFQLMDRNDLITLVVTFEKAVLHEYYQIDAATRERKCGYAVIFNHFTFDKLPPEVVENRTDLIQRNGTHKDSSDLEKLWKTYGMETVVHNDLTSSELQQKLNNLTLEKDFSAYQIFVCCVLSHGERDVFFASDGVEMSIIDLHSAFGKSAITLAGKPKLFFIQACQGTVNNIFVSDAINPKKGPQPKNDRPSSKHQIFPSNTCREDSPRPQQKDILIGMATVPLYKSFRHESNGSVYIQTLVKVLMEKGDTDEILELLREVNEKVSNTKITVKSDDGCTHELVCQMPTITHQFGRKRLILKKAQLD